MTRSSWLDSFHDVHVRISASEVLFSHCYYLTNSCCLQDKSLLVSSNAASVTNTLALAIVKTLGCGPLRGLRYSKSREESRIFVKTSPLLALLKSSPDKPMR